LSFAEKYRAGRELNAEMEAVIESFETGWRQRAACQTLESRRADLLLPLLIAVEDSWIACRDAERRYRRHSFRDTLATIGFWAFIVAVGFAPLTFLALSALFQYWPAYPIAGCVAVVLGAWLHAPRVPPWNVQDRRARAVTLAAEYLLESLRADDAAALKERHHAALLRVLDGCTNERSATCNVMLAISLLKALEQVGDGRYARRVERLAAHGHGMVRAAALACCPALRDRLTHESRVRALLRPCRLEEDGALLVRPASARHENPAQLVRPLEQVENRAA
jgi:hypothetical protein